MTSTEKMRRLYIILRWYDRSVQWLKQQAGQEVPETDTKLMIELEAEMRELQRNSSANRVKKKRKTNERKK
jgi:hypothetical protein